MVKSLFEMNNRILVTGASGFIGKNLVERLLTEKKKVKALVRNIGDAKFFRDQNVEVFMGDLLNKKSLDEPTKNVDIVFNLAGGLPHHHLSDIDYWNINVLGTRNLISFALKNKVKSFVHISTVGIYGTAPINVSERSKPNPSDVYSRSKLKGEEIVKQFQRKGLPTTIIRPTIAYGPWDTRPGFFDLFKLAKRNLLFPIGEGHNYFHTIYVENLIDALLLAVTKSSAIGEDFIIGDDPCPRMRDIYNNILLAVNKPIPSYYLPTNLAYRVSDILKKLKFLGIPQLLNDRRIDFLTQSKQYSIDKAKKILGYSPRVDIKNGINLTYNWYNKHGLL